MPPKEIPDELIDQLLAGHEGPEAITACGCRIFGFAWKADHSGGAQELAASPPSASPSLPR